MVQLATHAVSERIALVADLNRRYAGANPSDVTIGACRDEFPGQVAVLSSFGADAAVLLHMVAEVDRTIPVIFLDTLRHFPETLAYRDRLVAVLRLENVVVATPRPAHVEADDPDGDLHARDKDLCCHIRKTMPMLEAMRPYAAFFTGRKRYQTATRSTLETFDFQDRWIKVNPLADMSAADLEAYFDKYRLPRHPLVAEGYPSIGCEPCTSRVARGDDQRSGRWAGSMKTECGIHITADGRLVRVSSG